MKRKREKYKVPQSKRKNNGTRRSIGLGYIKDPKQRKCLYNKRLNGLIKKNVELVEISRSLSFNFNVNPDTKYMSLLSMDATKLQGLFFLFGHIIYMLDLKNKTNLKSIWEDQIQLLKDNILKKKDSSNFLNWIIAFNSISSHDIENNTKHVENFLKNLENFNY